MPVRAWHRWPMIGATIALLTACAAPLPSDAGPSPGQDSCTRFDGALPSDAHGAATAEEAVTGFLQSRSRSADGWSQAARDEAGVTVICGRERLHVARMPDGSWNVDSGVVCS